MEGDRSGEMRRAADVADTVHTADREDRTVEHPGRRGQGIKGELAGFHIGYHVLGPCRDQAERAGKAETQRSGQNQSA